MCVAHRNDNSIGVTTLKHLLRWLGHMFRISLQQHSHFGLFLEPGTGKKDWIYKKERICTRRF